MTHKQDKFILEVTSDPTLPWEIAAERAGYSKRRCGVVASEMRTHPGVMARIKAIREGQLQAGPTLDSYHATRNACKEMAMRHGGSTSAAWILLQVAAMEDRELRREPEQEEQEARVVVRFVDPDGNGRALNAEQGELGPLPEAEAAVLNKSAAEFEVATGMPQGTLGRVLSEPEIIETQSAPLKPVQPKPTIPFLRLNISDEERKRLRKMSMPVGGALSFQQCRVHGEFEAMWKQSADMTWGWSDCPACWQRVN